MKSQYIQGEIARYSIQDDGYTSVVMKYGNASIQLTKADSTWSAEINTDTLAGAYNFAVIADGGAVERGTFYVSQLVSKYRAVIDAIDEAMQGVASNGKYSVSVGEISLTDKTFDEMVKARAYYTRLADADENGVAPTFSPTRVSEVYA